MECERLSDLRWRKSRHSGSNANCVEVAPASGFAALRDSKDRHGGALRFDISPWRAFLATLTES